MDIKNSKYEKLFKFFFDIEKRMPQVAVELQDRRAAEYAAQGLEYISPAELERREIEAQKAEVEANRIADLKTKCAKRGLRLRICQNASATQGITSHISSGRRRVFP